MNNIINWTLGSFFRTLGRLLCFLLVGFLLFILISDNVHADTKKIDTIQFNESEWYINYGYWGSSMFTSGSVIDIYTTLIANNTAVNDTDNTVILDLCAGDGIIVKRTATVGNSCTNSCFAQNVSVQNLNRSCVLADNSSGFSFRVYLPVNKWDNRYVTQPNSHVYLQDKITISSKNYNSNFIVYGAYLTDELVSGSSDYSEINSQINALNSNINNTNSKLDDVNSKLNDTNSKLDDTNKNIKDTNDTLTDDSTDDKSSFFNNFQTSDYGLTSFVTAPVNFIKSLTTNCEPISLSVLSKNITLPCGDAVFWSRDDVAEFRTFWNFLFVGSILFVLGLRMYKTLESALNPRDFSDGFDVMAMNSSTGEVYNKRVGKGIFRR